MKRITDDQIKKVHVLKNILGLENRLYRGILSNFTTETGAVVKSSNELSIEQASELIDKLEKLIEKTPGLYEKTYASEKQLRFMHYLWSKVSRAPNWETKRKTLDSFIWRRFHARDINRLPKKVASKIILSLKAMEKRGTGV